jgi:hypothetical protein
MPIPQEVLHRLHKDEIVDVVDQTSRYSFKYKCACGVEGLFFSLNDADQYGDFHRKRQGVVDAKPIPYSNRR